jgi:predicted nucleic acid-binding protein
MDLIADTSYLVGLWRGQAWATSYATAHATKTLGLPWIVLGEFWHGAIVARHDAKEVQDFLSIGVQLVDPVPVVSHYARICAELSGQKEYRNIGQNDLWIAAVAMAHGKPLVSRNRRHFGLVEGLQVEALQD